MCHTALVLAREAKAWGGELDPRTDPCSLPSPSLWASWGQGQVGHQGLRFSMGWGWGGEPGDFIPQRHLATSRGILLGVGVLLGSRGGKATGAAHLPSGHRTEPTTKAILAPDVRTLPRRKLHRASLGRGSGAPVVLHSL